MKIKKARCMVASTPPFVNIPLMFFSADKVYACQ